MAHCDRRSACPISFALDLLGDRWTLLVVRDLVFMGKCRFSEFLASPEGVATNVLSDRLQSLEAAGLIAGSQDPDDGRRILYRLTDKGIGLIPTLLELARWGARNDPKTGAPAEMVERMETDRAGLIAEIESRHREV